MSMKFTWTITQVMHYEAPSPHDGFISKASWQCSGVDSSSGYSNGATGTVDMNTPPAGPPLIPLSQVTELEIFNWIFGARGLDPDGEPLPTLVNKQATEDHLASKAADVQTWGAVPWAVPDAADSAS